MQPLFQAVQGGSSPTPALDFWVEKISRKEAARLCAGHPHAPSLPPNTRLAYRLDIGGKFAGLAAWGYGQAVRFTARRLFGDESATDKFLELSRFFVADGSPKNTASKFLGITHRLVRRDNPGIRWLYTYAAGFQGLTGTIYQAAGYTYIGRRFTNKFLWVPGTGLIHQVSLWHAYGVGDARACRWQSIYPGSARWCGYNFEYVYEFGRKEFTAKPYPTAADLEIWLVNASGHRIPVDVEAAKAVPVVSLPYAEITPIRTPRAGSQWRDSGFGKHKRPKPKYSPLTFGW